MTHCRQLVDAPEFFVNESLLPTGRRLSDLADDCNSAYYNVTTTSNGARRSEPSSVSSRFEADIPSPRALRCNSLSVSRGQQTQKRCIDIPLGFGNRSCETVCFEQSLASGSRMPSKIRDSACCSVPVSESDAACALTQSCDSSYSHNCLHSLDSVSKRSDTAECNREVNWRRHSFGDIYRKLYSVVDGIVSQRWFTRSLSKFMGSSSQADDCTQCSPAAEECQSSVNYAVRSSKSMMYPSTNASCGVNFIQANAGATSSLGPLPSTITNPDKPPPVPPRTAVQLAYNNCQSEIQVQGKNSVKQLYENKPLDHKFDWDARSKDASSELSWRHTVLLCGPEGVSAKMKAATLGDIGRKSRVESQNLETQTVDEKSRLVTKNFRFMRSRSVGNQLCKSSPLCTKCCSICDLPLNVCYCMSSNNETRVSPTSAVSCGRLLLADVDSLCHDQLQSHQSRDHHLLTSSTSSLDQLGPPPPVPCVKIASNSPRVSASEPTVPVDGRESICRNSSIEHGYNKVDVHNSSDSGICRTSGTTGSANHERATRKSNLTVNTAYTAPPSDMSRLSAGQ